MSGTYDSKELELPDTVFIRDIETRVFQTIALQTLASIEGVSTMEGNLIDSFLGRDGPDSVKGIHVDQDQKNHSVKLKVEVNIFYGVSLPLKAEEIQSKITEEIGKMTGLHVGCVHVVFKNLILPKEHPRQVDVKEIEEGLEDPVEFTSDLK